MPTAITNPYSVRAVPGSGGFKAGCGAWIRAVRLRQWSKNLLVFVAPAAAGIGGTSATLTPLLVTCVVFCLLATSTYLLNDVKDADEDRRHPLKRHRPIASGALDPGHALAAAGISAAVGLVLATTVNWATLAAAAAYVVLNAAYTLCLRQIAVVEMVALSGAFVLRAIAGATAAGVPVSRTIIAVVALGAVFVAAGKRYADFIDPSARRSRSVLKKYSRASLKLAIALAGGATLWTYYAWAFGPADGRLALSAELTSIPFTLCLLRYAVIAGRGGGGAPEQVLFADRQLQVLGLIWLLLLVVGS